LRFVKLATLCAVFALFLIACNSSNSSLSTPAANSNSKPTDRTATQPSPQASPIDQFAATRKIYAQRCEVCHGKEGSGGPVEVAGKKLKVPSLREGHVLKHSDEALVKRINNGGDGMPPFKKLLKPEEIDALVKFLHQDFQGGTAGQMPDAAK
jgi:mono/diheme cytochrome c family protein